MIMPKMCQKCLKDLKRDKYMIKLMELAKEAGYQKAKEFYLPMIIRICNERDVALNKLKKK